MALADSIATRSSLTRWTTLRSWVRRTGVLRTIGRWRGLRTKRELRRLWEAGEGRSLEFSVQGQKLQLQVSTLAEFEQTAAQVGERELLDLFLSGLKPGDTVWDIGANVGVWSMACAVAVGAEGHVHAFEPAPHARERLARHRGENDLSVICTHPIALSNREGRGNMCLADDPTSGIHQLESVGGSDTSQPKFEVRLARGDQYLEEAHLLCPQAIKIDVEGAEPEVIEGLGALLENKALRQIFIEVHFGVLDARGMRHAPRQLEDRLQAAGLRTRWVDASHLMGLRESS